MVSTVTGSAFITDTVLYLREFLRSNITDPLGRAGAGSDFVFSSYPKENVTYPIITVKDKNFGPSVRLGMRTEQQLLPAPFEIRVWGKNVKQRDNLSQDIYYKLRTGQYGTGSESVNVDLHDFALNSMVNVDEDGEEGIKSKVIEIQYIFINV